MSEFKKHTDCIYAPLTDTAWEEFKAGDLGVVVKNENEADEFLKLCEEHDIHWGNEETATAFNPCCGALHAKDKEIICIFVDNVTNHLVYHHADIDHMVFFPSKYIIWGDPVVRNFGQTTIADSGDRREFPSGAVRDMAEGKGRCDLMPLDVVAMVLGFKTESFDSIQNPDRVISYIADFKTTGNFNFLYEAIDYFCGQQLICAETMLLELAQHFEAGAEKYGENNWQKGLPAHSYIDSAVRHYLKFLRGDTDERHDRAFVWNLVCCIWTCIHKPELNDYRKGESDK